MLKALFLSSVIALTTLSSGYAETINSGTKSNRYVSDNPNGSLSETECVTPEVFMSRVPSFHIEQSYSGERLNELWKHVLWANRYDGDMLKWVTTAFVPAKGVLLIESITGLYVWVSFVGNGCADQWGPVHSTKLKAFKW